MAKEILVLSGKGGTGKTTITAALAAIVGSQAVVADCDVDASDMHLLLAPTIKSKEDFYSGHLANIDQEACIQCGLCKDVCRFDAVQVKDNKHQIIPINCEGCKYCALVCPTQAIEMMDSLAGQVFVSESRLQNTFVHARLGIGAENSGKLVTKVRKMAKSLAEEKELPYVLIDGTPGIACPVIASLSGVHYAVIVTEASISGFHDLERVHQLIQKMNVTAACILNKADVNPNMRQNIIDYLNLHNIELLAELPFDKTMTDTMVQEITIMETEGNVIADRLRDSWKKIQTNLENNSKI